MATWLKIQFFFVPNAYLTPPPIKGVSVGSLCRCLSSRTRIMYLLCGENFMIRTRRTSV